MNPTHEEFLAELESLGVGKVKERIATNVYLGGLRNIAEGWVARTEAASSAEQLTLAYQAHMAAQNSNRIAITALVIAAISMVASIVAVFKH